MPTDIGSGVLLTASTTGSGTGNYNSFLRVQNDGEEKGFNTNDNNQLNNKDGVWTHALLLSSLDIITVGSTQYYEIRLDLNETNSKTGPNISLDDLQIYWGSAAVASDYSSGGLSNVNLHKVFDLDHSEALVDHNHGSGTDDYQFLIPVSLFAGAGAGAFFTLYSDFSGADGGFEEFRVRSSAVGDGLPSITLVKTADPTSIDEGSSHDVTYTYTLTNTSALTDPLTLTSLIDDNGTPGTGAEAADDVDLLSSPSYFTGGDSNSNGKLDVGETWTFEYTRHNVTLDPGVQLINTATVNAIDDEGNNATAHDDAEVDGNDVLPLITLVKDADPTVVNEGTVSSVTYTYTLTSQSASTDSLTLTSFVDDNGTPGSSSPESDDDVNLLSGASGTNLGIYYVSGDDNHDGLLQNTEAWVFSYTRNDVYLNADETLVNTALVHASDDEGNDANSHDDATVTGQDVTPDINIVKDASVSLVQAGLATDVTFSYTITNTSTTTLDPLTLTSLVDDGGTPNPLDSGDNVDLLNGASGTDLGIYYDSGDDGDGLLETGESWVFKYTTSLTLMPGETRTNIVTVDGHDDEGDTVHDTDDASVTAYNLGRTPGFWINNGSKLWDGDTTTFPKAGGLGIVQPGHDLMYKIYDTNGDGSVDHASGANGYLMIGDWSNRGYADAGENVLVVSRDDALKLLDASQKQQQDGRWMVARDVIASWLNYLGGSYVGDANDPNSARHYIDEAVAWLQQTTSDHNHVLTVAELNSGKIATSSSAWNTGFDFNGSGVHNDVPGSGDVLGSSVSLDILGGGAIHTHLDHYNNFGFV